MELVIEVESPLARYGVQIDVEKRRLEAVGQGHARRQNEAGCDTRTHVHTQRPG